MLDPKWRILATVAFVPCLYAMTAQAETPLSTAFTYQGQLKHDGVVVTDLCDFEYTLWDAVTAGEQIGTAETKVGVDVRDGLFSLQLDFGTDAFNGSARWLAMSVKCSDDLSFVSFGPRQPITGTPYALQTRGMFVDDAGNVGVGTTNPTARLDVSGTLKLGDDKLNCDGTTEGSVRYNNATKVLECCNGSSWNEVGGGGVPSGTVIFHDPSPCELCTCPAGWTEVKAARGRVLLGVPEGGTMAGVQGAPLTDLESRSHQHTVDVWASNYSGEILELAGGTERTVITNLIDPGNKFMSWHNTLTYVTHGMKGKRETTESADHTIPYLQLLVCRKN